jgi:hypothetical protein
MDTVKKEHIDDFKDTILRDIKLQTAIKKMFRAMLIILIASSTVITILSGLAFSLYLKQPTKKERLLIDHLNSEKEYIQKSRQEVIVLKKLTLERDSIQLEEFRIMNDAFRTMVNDEYIENARKNKLK